MKRLYFVMLSLSVLLVSSLLLIYSNVTGLLSSQKESKKIIVYMKPSEAVGADSEIIQYLNNEPRVDRFLVETKAKLMENFNDTFPEYSQGLSLNEDILSLIPQVIEISFKSAKDVEPLASNLRALASVGEVQANFFWLDKLSSFKSLTLNFVIFLFSFFAFVLIVITVLIAHKFVLNEKDKLQIYSFCGANQKQIFEILFSKFYLISLGGLGCGLCLSYLFYVFTEQKIIDFDVEKWFVNRIHFLQPLDVVLLSAVFIVVIYSTITFSAKSALKEVWNDD
jgi:cell division protein FtsX